MTTGKDVIIIAKEKSKSLLNKTSKPKKKQQDKYSEDPLLNVEYSYNVNQRLIYIGLIEIRKGQDCIVLKRSRRKSTENYKIKFDDGEELKNVEKWFLKTSEEYQLLLEQKEKEIQNKIENGNSTNLLDSYNNFYQCLDSPLFYNRGCDRCKKEPKCIYRNKFQYDKMKYN